MTNLGFDSRSKLAGDLAGMAGQQVYAAAKKVCPNPLVCGAVAVAASLVAVPLALFAIKLVYKNEGGRQ